jgi:DNA-binding MarR family transcriptional regulator
LVNTTIVKRGKTARRAAVIPPSLYMAQVSSLINLAARLTSKAARIRLGELGAWPGQIPLLLWLLEEDGLIQKELVQRAKMEQSTVAEHLDRLERDGFIRRRRLSSDKRKFGVFLTSKARAMSEELVTGLETGAHVFTAGIPKGDLATFDRVIRQIILRLEGFIEESEQAALDDQDD